MPQIERIIPLLTYRDLAAAHDFLVRAFGFTSGGVHRSPDGEAPYGLREYGARDPEGHRW
jgi:uncharacterized glyoxalase superfamily protein PhnB